MKPRRRAGCAPRAALLVLLILPALAVSPLAAQHSLTSPAGRELPLPRDLLLRLDDTTRALRQNLEADPRVLYFTAFGEPIGPDSAEAGLPWNAVEVLTDSSAAVLTPANLREADRAYANYAVLRMQAVRGDPDVACDSLVALEVRAVSGFVDGWIVARTLYGGPPNVALDELAFARAAGHLAGLIGGLGDRQLGGCLGAWQARHPREIEAYERWRREEYLGAPGGL